MARFRGQILYLRAATRDVTFGTDVRSALGTAGADTNFTITYTAAATQTVDPYTNISNVTADNRLNLGWALNQNDASEDSMGSGTDVGLLRLRVIPAGTWSFSNSIAGSAPALLTNYNVTVEYSVYRVAANSGTRTLLFSFSGAAINRTAAGTFTASATSPAQPAYIFQANETVHVAYRITSAPTQAVLGGTTNTVLTINGATSASQSITLPAPGLRDYFIDTNQAVGEAVGLRSNLVRKDLIQAIGEALGQYDYDASFFRTFNAVGEGAGTRALLVVIKDRFVATGSGVGSRALLVRKDVIMGTGEAVGLRSNLIRKDLIQAIGEGSGEITKQATFVRDFLSEGESVADLKRVVIFVRDFEAIGEAVIRPRIALDWDDLPTSEGGNVVINTYRPLFVFDD